MKIEMDEDVVEFLQALDPSTMKVYRAGLSAFKSFYAQSLKNFLDAVEEDLRKPRREKKRVARNTLKGFVKWLEKREKKPKTIRAYVSSVQSLAGYYDIPLTTRYVNLPPSTPYSSKFPWTLEKVAEFVEMIEDLQLKSITVTLFQSGLSVSDTLALTYGDIKYEYEHEVVPLCLDLSRIKTDVPFMTFIGKWGFQLLKTHLEERRLKLDTPLYSLSHRTIDHHFKNLAKTFIGEYRGNNPCCPHSLRAAFRTLLGDTGMPTEEIHFFMGHRLPEQQRVYHSRSREGWRKIYAKYERAITPKRF